VKEVSFKPGVKDRWSYRCTKRWIRKRSDGWRNRWVGNGGTGARMRFTKRQRELGVATNYLPNSWPSMALRCMPSVKTVRNLGIRLDSDLSTRASLHWDKSATFDSLCQLAQIQKYDSYPTTKRFALVAGARTYHIQAVCSDVHMSQWLSTTVSVWTTPASRWRWVKAEAAIVINFSTGCAVHATIHYLWPHLYCRRTSCMDAMEQSAWLTAPTVIIGTIQKNFENSFI